MANDLANLQLIKSNILARLVDLSANPKPNYSIEGKSVSWGSYFESLTKQLTTINELLQSEQPFEYRSYGIG